MAIAGTPNAGLDEIGRSAYVNHPPYTLVAYCNARDSLGPNTLVTNLVQPAVNNGYAPILLDGVWTSVNGDVTYTHRPGAPKPRWNATGAWSGGPVRGHAMVYNAIVVHFCDLTTADFVAANGAFLDVDLLTII